ncbi:MAG: hypothetical protein IJZ55_08870 [Lachnospiraceae bacterium]|nr:hypothetical protein [Lachnospiraceae bacterium]
MGKNASSCSTEQQKMERNLFPLIEEWLGVELKSDAKVYVGDAHIEPDFINEDEKIVGEIFAHIGTLLEGQKRKLAQDVLKMLLLERNRNVVFRKIIVVCDKAVYTFLTGKSWLAECISEFGVEIKFWEISEEERKNIIRAQVRQYR